ncbi:hypothetical protein H310_07619 [Aphanomyces invadans]|uniref:Uncharacterized protein n=1 Tax=Aphanomyces invadans TaxID=157072 RepID=A0A024U3M9_9STRA|nr:hypothetical protein H310_07619 [Aphanomyces invadans]ETW00228.1 hypothetical protein H310_07619 [Aphanomyces invadans]|eukprot:XP_008871253.1 hypothetical protein H310_07619 [Aphanomyces invadans]
MAAWADALHAEDVRAAWLTMNFPAFHGTDASSIRVVGGIAEVDDVDIPLKAFFHLHSVHEARVRDAHVHVPLLIDGSLQHLVLPLYAQTSQLDQFVNAFCLEHSLIPLYCTTLRQHAAAYTNHSTNRTSVQVCVATSVASSPPYCVPLPTDTLRAMDSLSHIQTTDVTIPLQRFQLPPMGTFVVRAWLDAVGASPSAPNRLSRPVAKTLRRAAYACTSAAMPKMQILYPRNGQVVAASLTHVSVSLPRLLLDDRAFFTVCISTNQAKRTLMYHSPGDSVSAVDEYPPFRPAYPPRFSHHERVEATSAGSANLFQRYKSGTNPPQLDHAAVVCMPVGVEHSVDFELDASLPRLPLPSSLTPTLVPDLVLVTAVSQSYVDEGRLANLVGSLRVWEPSLTLYVVGLDLHPATEAMVQMWPQVHYMPFDALANGLPRHVFEFRRTYAFKPIVIAHFVGALSTRVLWVDANVELRRPLDRIRRAMAVDGHFFTVQGATFPLAANNHPITLAHFSCPQHGNALFQCWWSGLQGYTRGGVAAIHLLAPMVACAMNETCFAPPSSRYPDQTVLNAAVCGFSHDLASTISVHPGLEFWLSSSLDDSNQPLQPTPDEVDWNDVVFFTRREVPAKPYAGYV